MPLLMTLFMHMSLLSFLITASKFVYERLRFILFACVVVYLFVLHLVCVLQYICTNACTCTTDL